MSRAEQTNLEAADWLIAQAEGPLSSEQQAAFDAWFEASDANKAAYWRLEYGWEEADRVAALGYDLADQDTAVSHRAWRRWVPTAIAASIAVAVGINWLVLERPGSGPARQMAGPAATETYVTVLGKSALWGWPMAAASS